MYMVEVAAPCPKTNSPRTKVRREKSQVRRRHPADENNHARRHPQETASRSHLQRTASNATDAQAASKVQTPKRRPEGIHPGQIQRRGQTPRKVKPKDAKSRALREAAAKETLLGNQAQELHLSVHLVLTAGQRRRRAQFLRAYEEPTSGAAGWAR